MPRRLTADLAYLTAPCPGIGGCLRLSADDFQVYEQPLRQPSGDGDYLWLCVERRRRMTTDVARRIAKMFGVPLHDVGYAGLKDKHALTRQHFSVRLPDTSRDARAARFEFTGMRLLWARRDHRPLERGDLRGNFFRVRIRRTRPNPLPILTPILQQITAHGLPNYFGYQRFGYRQNNHILGALLVARRWQEFLDQALGGVRPEDAAPLAQARRLYHAGDYAAALRLWPRSLRHDRQVLDALRQHFSPARAVMTLDAHHRRFLVSALQSAMFNDVLDRRVRAGLLTRWLPGDRAMRAATGDCDLLDVAAAAHAQADPTCDRVPSGPMWGPRMPLAAADVARWEEQALLSMGLSLADLPKFADAAAVTDPARTGGPVDPVLGARRPLRVAVQDLDWGLGSDADGPFVSLSFSLPRGSFATALLREVMKTGDE